MLLHFAVLEKTSLEYAAIEFLDLELDQVVDGATGRALNFKAVGDKLLMQNVQVGRVHGIFHRLKPVAIQLRQRAQPVPAIGARPDIVFWNCRRRVRSEVSPVKPRQLFDRISCVLHSPAKVALRRLSRGFKTIAVNIVEPAMISAGNAPLLDS